MSNPLNTNDLQQIIHKINNPLAVIACKVDYLLLLVKNKSIDESNLTKDLKVIHDMTFQISELLNQLKNNHDESFSQSNQVCLNDARPRQ